MAELTAHRSAAAALRRTARGGVVNLVGAAFSGVGGVVVTWLVAASLGPHAAGQFFAATSAFLLAVALARLGTPTGVVYWTALTKKGARPGATGRVLRAAAVPAGVAVTVAAIAMWAAAPWLGTVQDHGGGPFTDALRILAVFLPCAVAVEILLAATRGLGRMRPSVVIDKLGRTTAQLVSLGAVVATGGGVIAVTWAWTWSLLPAAVWAWWSWRRLSSALPPGDKSSDVDVDGARFWAYTWPRALGGVAQLALQRLDILLVAGMIGFAEAALYTVATRFVTLGQLAAGAVGTAVQPRLARSMGRGDFATARTLYQTTTAWIVLATWPLFLTTGVAATHYLGLFGDEYTRGATVVVVWLLAAGMLVSTGCGVVDMVLAMAGRTGWQLYNVGAALIVNVGLDLLLIPRWGIVGAAVGWAAALAVNNLVPLFQLASAYRLHPFGRATTTAMAVAAACFVLPVAAAEVFGATALTVTLIAVSALYLVIVWRLRAIVFRPVTT